jgi:Ca-activated chloride channel family protein
LLLFAALARPQFGFQWVEAKRKGIDLLFAFDTSKSMLVEDIKPNRLQRASLAIHDFVEKLEGDRVGLMPFAGSAYLLCPLTIDYDAFFHSLAAVNTDLIPQGGTNIGAVIEKAVQTLDNGANHKILIILTDGENLQGDAVAAAEAAAKKGLTIHTVGVGTSQGELIPTKKDKGGDFIKDDSGNFVTSRLNEATLRQISEKSKGLYVPLGAAGEGLATIYQQKLALIPKDELAEKRHKVPIERFQWPLALATLLLMIEMLIGERKISLSLPFLPRARTLFDRLRPRRSGKALGLVLLLVAGLADRGYASEGEEAYLRGDYLQASEYYQKKLAEKPDDPQLLYNFGTAAYKNNLFDDAITAFSGALKSDAVDLQKKAYYNRGNSHYAKGAEMRQADPQAAANQWRQALASLNSALELDPADADAKHNKEVIAEQLAELEKQLEKQQQEKQDQQGKEDKDQQEKNGENKDQGEKQQSDPEKANEDAENSRPESKEEKERQQAEATPEKEAEQQGAQAQEGGEQPAEADKKQEEQGKQAEQAANDALRQQLGKMTKEEAEQLLNALKNEEGNLNFVPAGRRGVEKDINRDW